MILSLTVMQTGHPALGAHSRIIHAAPHKKFIDRCCYRYCSRLLVSGTKLTDMCFFCVTLPSDDLSNCSSFWLPLWLPTGTNSRPVPGLNCSINCTQQQALDTESTVLCTLHDHVFKTVLCLCQQSAGGGITFSGCPPGKRL